MSSVGGFTGELRGAYASRVLVSASRRNGLSELSLRDWGRNGRRRVLKVRRGGTPRPTRGTRMLPGNLDPRTSRMQPPVAVLEKLHQRAEIRLIRLRLDRIEPGHSEEPPQPRHAVPGHRCECR